MPMDWLSGFNGAAKDFIDCIITDRQPEIDVPFPNGVLQATLAVYASSEPKREVDSSAIG